MTLQGGFLSISSRKDITLERAASTLLRQTWWLAERSPGTSSHPSTKIWSLATKMLFLTELVIPWEEDNRLKYLLCKEAGMRVNTYPEDNSGRLLFPSWEEYSGLKTLMMQQRAEPRTYNFMACRRVY